MMFDITLTQAGYNTLVEAQNELDLILHMFVAGNMYDMAPLLKELCKKYDVEKENKDA